MIPPGLTLADDLVQLRPLTLADAPALWAIAQEPEIWQYMRSGHVDSYPKMELWIRHAFTAAHYPFLTLHLPSGKVAGSTRYLSIDPPNRSLEIGSTWLSAEFRRSGVNTHAKFLMLRHAFEVLDCLRVQFRTDSRNTRSQAAIERLGATKEGIFRKDFIYPDGYQRDTVFYSIVAPDWPSVKQRLLTLL